MTSTLVVTPGDPDADSYISAVDALAYHNRLGNEGWLDGDDESWDQVLRKATIYLDGRYRGLWKGTRAYVGPSPVVQALAWPRSGVLDEDGAIVTATTIPRVLTYACAEAALRELQTPGSLSPDLDRLTRIERVGPIEVEYMPGTEPRADLTIVSDLLSGLLIGNSGNSSITFFARA